jgi:hypothetical protein
MERVCKPGFFLVIFWTKLSQFKLVKIFKMAKNLWFSLKKIIL